MALTPEQMDTGYARFGEGWHNMGPEQQLAAIASSSALPPQVGGDRWFAGMVDGQLTANQGYAFARPDGTRGYFTYNNDPALVEQILAAFPGSTLASAEDRQRLNTPDKGFGGVFDAIEKVGDAAGPGIVGLPFLFAALASMAGLPAAGATAGASGASGANLAALIESGTVGAAGAGLEAAAGVGLGGAGAGGFAPDAISAMIDAVNTTGAATATEAAAQLGFPSIEAYLQGINPSWITPGFNVNVPGGGLAEVASQPNFLDRITSFFTGGNQAPLVGDLMPNINAQAMAELAGGPGAFGNISMPGLSANGLGVGVEEELWKRLMKQAMGVGGGALGMIANIGSGLLGLNKSGQIQDTAAKVAAANDPFGPYRSQYAQQLSALSANPNLITSTPGYQFGIDQGNQALMRTMAARGYTGSGNEMIALQRFNQDYAGRHLAAEQERLARLAGAGISGNSNALLTGEQLSTDLMSKALASIGYGLKGW